MVEEGWEQEKPCILQRKLISLYIARSFHPDFEDIPCRKISMDLINKYESLQPMIKNSALVIAATSDIKLNYSIKLISEQEKILCNVAAGESGDVILPAKISGLNYTVAVTTYGSVPTVSRMIREHLEESFPDLDDIVVLGEWIRDEFRVRSDNDRCRNYEDVLFEALRDPNTRKALADGQARARAYILENYS